MGGGENREGTCMMRPRKMSVRYMYNVVTRCSDTK